MTPSEAINRAFDVLLTTRFDNGRLDANGRGRDYSSAMADLYNSGATELGDEHGERARWLFSLLNVRLAAIEGGTITPSRPETRSDL